MSKALATVAAVLMAGGLAACGSGGDPAADRVADAEQACKETISGELKDPDSAKWKDVESAKSTTDPGDAWTVEGGVSGVNGFGGRNGFKDFTCVTRWNDDDGAMNVSYHRVDW
ncbi:lipoprotein [Nocardiaceae bacterium NPDC056970]